MKALRSGSAIAVLALTVLLTATAQATTSRNDFADPNNAFSEMGRAYQGERTRANCTRAAGGQISAGRQIVPSGEAQQSRRATRSRTGVSST